MTNARGLVASATSVTEEQMKVHNGCEINDNCPAFSQWCGNSTNSVIISEENEEFAQFKL